MSDEGDVQVQSDAGASGDKQDIPILCRDCSKEFMFTVGEQEFYEQKGFDNQPNRCVECRKAKKQHRDGGGYQRGGRGGGRNFGGEMRGSSGPFTCHKCGQEGHKSFECSQGGDGQQGNGRFGGGDNDWRRGGSGEDGNNFGGGAFGGARRGGRGGFQQRDGGDRPRGVCYNFKNGSCDRGDSCRFAHN